MRDPGRGEGDDLRSPSVHRASVGFSRGTDISSCPRRKGVREEDVLRVCGESERKARWAAGCPSLPPDPEKNNTVLYTVLKHDI